MKNTKGTKTVVAAVELLLFPLLMIVLGAVLTIYPDTAISMISTVIGWILVAGGVVELLVMAVSWPYRGVPRLLVGVVFVAIGCCITQIPMFLAKNIGILVGLCLIVYGGNSLYEAYRAKKAGFDPTPGQNAGIITLAVGIVVLLAPLMVSRLVFRLCGVGLIVVGGINICIRGWYLRRPPREDGPDIVDEGP